MLIKRHRLDVAFNRGRLYPHKKSEKYEGCIQVKVPTPAGAEHWVKFNKQWDMREGIGWTEGYWE